MLTRHSLWLALALLVPGTPALAEIYKYYDADGNLVLTDTVPKQHAEKVKKVEPRPIMTIPALPHDKRPSSGSAARPASEGTPSPRDLSESTPSSTSSTPSDPSPADWSSRTNSTRGM